MDESLEESSKKQMPGLVRLLSILVYVGNIGWGLVLLGFFFWFMISGESFGERFHTKEIPVAAFAAFLLIMELTFVLCIVGARGMVNGRRLGFWFFCVGNLPWILINSAAGIAENIVVAGISVCFIVAFASQWKNYK